MLEHLLENAYWMMRRLTVLCVLGLCPIGTLPASEYGPQDLLHVESLIAAEQIDSALTLLREALRVDAGNDISHKAKVYSLLAEIAYYYLEDERKALEHLREAFDLRDRRRSRRPNLSKVWLRCGQLALNMGELNLADGFFVRAADLANDFFQYDLLIEIFDQHAIIYSQNGLIDLARDLRKKALQLALKETNFQSARDMYRKLAMSSKQVGDLDSAVHFFRALIALDDPLATGTQQVGDIRELALIYRQQGEHAEAQALLFNALEKIEVTVDTIATFEVLMEIGKLFNEQQRWLEALENIKHARSLLNTWNRAYPFMEMEILKQARIAIEGIGGEENGDKYLEEALQQARNHGNPAFTAELFFELGKARAEESYLDSALLYFNEVLVRKLESQESLGVVSTNLAIAQVHLARKEGDKAIAILRKNLLAAQRSHSAELLVDLHGALSEAYRIENNYRPAYAHHRRHSILKDSLLSLEKARAIEEVNQRYKRNKERLALIQDRHQAETERNLLELQNRQRLIIFLVTGFVALTIIALLAFYNYRARQQQKLQQQQLEVMDKEKESQHLRSMILGEENERKRVAQELHDGLGTLLATVKLHFNAVQDDLPVIPRLSNYQKAYDLLDNACSEVRKISYNMMPGILQQYGLEYAVNDMCNSIGKTSKVDISFISYGLDRELEKYVEVSVYRIIQELLKNILKHAAAREVIVQMTIEDDNFNLIVEDDGKGFDPHDDSNRSGLGLKNIRSRVALLKGVLTIESTPGEGSTFTIDFPLRMTLIPKLKKQL